MQDARSVIALDVTFHQLAGHLHTNTEHGLGHFHVLTLQESLGVLGEIQGYQGAFVLGTAQLDPAIRQLDNF